MLNQHPDPVRSINVSTDSDNRLVITFRLNVLTDEGHTFTVEPSESLDLLRDIAAHVSYQSREVARDLYIGDCATCGNVRLVERAKPNGNPERVHCPDCSDRRTAAQGFPPRPRIGGGEA